MTEKDFDFSQGFDHGFDKFATYSGNGKQEKPEKKESDIPAEVLETP